jgi:hypothetical protein
MSDKKVFVYIYLNNINHLVGTLWFHQRNQKESTSFSYDEKWLSNPHRFGSVASVSVK